MPNSLDPVFSNIWVYLGRSLWDLRGGSPYDFHARIMKLPEGARFAEFETCFHEYLETAGKLLRECCDRCRNIVLRLPAAVLSESPTEQIQAGIERKIEEFSSHARRWLWRVCEGPSSLDMDVSRLGKAHLEWSAPEWLIKKELWDMLRWEDAARSYQPPDRNKMALDRLEADLKQRIGLRLRDGVLGDELLLIRSAEAAAILGASDQPATAAKPSLRKVDGERERLKAAVKSLRRRDLTYEQMMPELDRLEVPIPARVSWFNAATSETQRSWVNAWQLNDRTGDSKPVSQYLGYVIREAEAQGDENE